MKTRVITERTMEVLFLTERITDYPSGKKAEEETSVILKSSVIIIIIKLTPSFVRMFYFATRVYNLLSAYDIVRIGIPMKRLISFC